MKTRTLKMFFKTVVVELGQKKNSINKMSLPSCKQILSSNWGNGQSSLKANFSFVQGGKILYIDVKQRLASEMEMVIQFPLLRVIILKVPSIGSSAASLQTRIFWKKMCLWLKRERWNTVSSLSCSLVSFQVFCLKEWVRNTL